MNYLILVPECDLLAEYSKKIIYPLVLDCGFTDDGLVIEYDRSANPSIRQFIIHK
jgi:hypothetical protein